jgi:hypothetical protein
MPGVFRRLRSDLIQRERVLKYLLYAVGEVVLIVIGILLALQMDELRERRGDAEREREALSLLHDDLTRDVTEFDRHKRQRTESAVPYLRAILDGEWDGIPLDSLPLKGTPYFNFQPHNSAYQGLKSSGTLSLIQSDSLRDEVIQYYEWEYISLSDWSSWHKNFVTNTLEPYMFNELAMGPDELVTDLDHLKVQLEGRRLRSLLGTQIGSMTRLDEQVEEAREHAVRTIAHIDRVLVESK